MSDFSHDRPENATTRRNFLTQVGALGLVTASGCASAASAQGAGGAPVPRGIGKFDDSWTARINTPYRAVFNFSDPKDAVPVGKVDGVMSGFADSLGLAESELRMVLVIRHTAIVAAFDDSMWSKYDLGDGKIKDPTTGEPAKRNPFFTIARSDRFTDLDANGSLSALHARGVILLGCNAAAEGLAAIIARKARITVEQAKAEMGAHRIPGVVMQPNGIYALVRAQNVGCALIV